MISYNGAPWMFTVSIMEFRGDLVAHERIYIMDGFEPAEWRAPWRAERRADPVPPAPRNTWSRAGCMTSARQMSARARRTCVRGRQIPTVERGFAPKMEQVSAPGALPAHLSGSLELMSRLTIDEPGAAIDALISAADEFAERAQLQETCRDRSRPGTGSHHQHAHSATLWRQAEQRLRTRILELELKSGK